MPKLSLTTSLIVLPHSFVLSTISMVVNTVPVSLVVLPLTVVDITISVDQSTSAISLVILPVAFIQTAINPNLNSFSIFAVLLIPLTFVLSSVVKDCKFFTFAFNFIVILGLGIIVEGFKTSADLHH